MKKHDKKSRRQRIIFIVAIVLLISMYIPVPYFVMTPGSAIEVDKLIEVEGANEENGKFMMTTVSMGSGNIISFIYSKFNSYMKTTPKENVLAEGEDKDDYINRQMYVMEDSQEKAIITAHKYLELPLEIKSNGLIVTGISTDAPANKVLKVGDKIKTVDDQPVSELAGLLSILKDKQVSDVVAVEFIRDNKTLAEDVELVDLNKGAASSDNAKSRAGIGIYTYEDKDVITSKEIEFKSEDIGGPSAGLMFTLEIINQLIPEDLTKGHRIAGTGTISTDGTVGQIGSARMKVKAAAEQNAEIFFVPKDKEEIDVNQKNAIQSNEDLGNPMKIVPVATLDEAVKYLKQLEEKSN